MKKLLYSMLLATTMAGCYEAERLNELECDSDPSADTDTDSDTDSETDTGTGWDTDIDTDVERKRIDFNSSSADDNYNMLFSNNDGVETTPFVIAHVTEDGDLRHGKYGAFVFNQGEDDTDPDNYTIWDHDWFLVSHDGDLPTGNSNVLLFLGVDTEGENNWVSFREWGSLSNISLQYLEDLPPCEGEVQGIESELYVGGYVYDFKMCGNNDKDVRLLFDLDDDGVYGGKSNIVVQGGGIFDLGEQETGVHWPIIPKGYIDLKLTTPAGSLPEVEEDETLEFRITSLDTGEYPIGIEIYDQPDIGLEFTPNPYDKDDLIGWTYYGVIVMISYTNISVPQLTFRYPVTDEYKALMEEVEKEYEE